MEKERQAQTFKALAHPIRLAIVEILLERERCVNDIKDIFEATQSNISQHLNILKYSGIVDFRKNGNLHCYYLTESEKNTKIIHSTK